MAVAALLSTETTEEPADRELIERTLAGDEDAFAFLVSRYQKRIYRVALAILRNDTDADVVTQDAFVQAFLNLKRFEGRSEFETWLTRIAINRSRDALRSRRRFGRLEGSQDGLVASEPADERPDAERQAAGRQILNAIENAATKLSAQQRMIFRLRHYEDMSLDRIAELMGLKPGTVRVHLFRAVHKIRKELKDWTESVE